MGLRDIPIPSDTVTVAGHPMVVRSFTPLLALGLYYRHPGALSRLFDAVAAKVASGAIDYIEIAAEMASAAPRLVAEVIVLAAGGDPDGDEFNGDIEHMMQMPIGVQAEAVQKIFALTFTPDMPPGKFAAVVLRMAQGAMAALQSANPETWETGSGSSASR